MIGDAYPHDTRHPKNPDRFDWRKEVKQLASKGVIVHAVQCLHHYGNGNFWKELAKLGNGVHLKLDQFSHLEHLLIGMGHFTSGGAAQLTQYESSLERVSNGVARSFAALRNESFTPRGRTKGRTPVDGSVFQVLTCDSGYPQDVKEFAVEKGLIASSGQFNTVVKGHLFYAHTERREELRPTHHVVIQDLETDEFYSGDEAREWLGCPYGDSKKLPPNPLGERYRVWLQSKSINRKLRPGQEVMVEMTSAIEHAMA